MRANRPTLTWCAIAAIACLLLVCGTAGPASAQDQIEAKLLVTNLLNPSGLAVHEGTGHIFIANRYGVYRYTAPGKDKEEASVKIEVLAAGNDVYGKGPMYDVGPLGLAFLDKDHLVVGDGSRPDGQELLRIYKVSAEAPSMPASEDSAVHTLGPITAEEGVTVKGEGNFYGVAVGANAIFVTCNGDDTKGWISKVELKDGQPAGKLTPSIATKVAIEEHDGTVCDAPVAITFSPDGKSLVVGQMGEMTVPGDSLLTFYNPDDGKLTKSYKTGLSDIAGLAYSPKTGKLYATDFSWHDTSQGGLFELAIDGDEVKATKIIGLDKPAAIVFDEQGSLYLTEFGTAEEDDTKLPGTLKKIEAGL